MEGEREEGYVKWREGGRDRGRLLQREGGGGREGGREKEVITKRGREEWRVLQG